MTESPDIVCCPDTSKREYESDLGIMLQSSALSATIMKHSKTVIKWYRSFRQQQKFQMPYLQKHNLPAFLELNPFVCELLNNLDEKNLVTLSIENMSEYIHDLILPKMVSDYRKGRTRGSENDEYIILLNEMLYKYGLTCIFNINGMEMDETSGLQI